MVVLDLLKDDPRKRQDSGSDRAPRPASALRHPEKAHRPDQPAPSKPDWIRVKAPGSRAFAETRMPSCANMAS